MNLTVRLISLAIGGAFLLSHQEPNPLDKAAPIDQSGLSGADVELIQALNHAGVPVVATASCAWGVHASYYPGPNAIVVCTNHPTPDFSDTLRHEAIHVAQDCKAGLANTELEILSPSGNPFLGTSADNELSHQVLADYPPELRGLEYEAWALAEQFTSLQVAQLVREACR